ncbi:mitochondrial glycine transporter Ymc1p [Diutina catenulata]
MSDSFELDQVVDTVDNSLSRKLKDVAAGFVGGATQVLIGQPFDLVKVRLQTAKPGDPQSMGAIVKSVLQNEGPLAFYKGTLAPLFGVGACVSLQFYGFHETKRQLLARSGGTELPLWPQTYIAGAVAGIVNTPVAGPVEQLRILSQADKKATHTLSSMVKQIYRSNGVAGIFRGTGITLVREVQAYGVWFLTYETLIRKLVAYHGYKSRDQIGTPELLACGALAGNALWLSSYPIDVIKSNIQSDKFGPESRFHGKVSLATKHILATNGWRGFWRGLIPCLTRAVPCSAGTFASVELALRVMG